jgi:O-antigen ligase
MTLLSATVSSRSETRHWGSFVTSVWLAATLSVGPLVLGAFRIWLLLPILISIWLLVLFQGVRLVLSEPKEQGHFGDGADLFAVLFLAYAIFRYFTTPVEYLARIEVLSIISYAAVFWICRYGFSRKSGPLYLLGILAVIGLIVTASGYLFRLQPSLRPFAPELLMHYGTRFCGTYGCPNHFGAFVVMTFSILLSFCFLYRSSWTLRIICFYLAGMMAVAVALSMSRGSWLGLGACLLAMAFFLVRQGYIKWYWPMVGAFLMGLGVALFLYLSPSALSRVTEFPNRLRSNTLDGYVRIELARDALKIWKDYPVFGSGPATFVHMHMRYQSPTYSTLAQYTHDDYFNLLADYGLVGLLIGLGFIVCVTRQLFRYLGEVADVDDSMLVLSALGAWSALLVHSWVDFNMHIPANALVLFALAGIGLRRSSAHVEMSPGWLKRSAFARPLGLVLMLLSVGLLAFTVYTARGYYPYFFAERDYGVRTLDVAFELGQKAVDADPRSPYALKYLGDLYRNRAAEASDPVVCATDAQQAAELYARAVAVNPYNDELLALQGLSYDLMRRYPEAYFIHSTVIQRQPYNGYFHLLMGLHYWRRNMLPDAQTEFEKGASCPHGREDNGSALKEINQILGEPVNAKPPLDAQTMP